jgi:hypothetical protein
VDDFWREVGEVEPFPRNLESAVLWALPLFVVKVPRLSVDDVSSTLAEYGVSFRMGATNRRLHGCLVAFSGKGVVMLDGTDPSEDLRFSLAHEVGHFIIDYQRPRQRAIHRVGASIVEVLDGARMPSVDERIDAVLSDVRIGVHTHLMDRGAGASAGCGRITGSEFRADRLAYELLAPEAAVLSSPEVVSNFSIETLDEALENRFGLPVGPANEYARFLAKLHQPRMSMKTWLGMEDTPERQGRLAGKRGVSNFPELRRNNLQDD